jgi:hypothetical protein
MGMHGMKKKPVKKMMGGTGKKAKVMKPGGGLYKMMAGGTMKKATQADITKAMGGANKKPNAGAVRMAKGILKKAGMKAVPAAYGAKVMRKKKK